ncbi:MAG: transporter substrate-binding domain-containing protein, partial [Rhodocyclaceae bacterium]|nr:transporter substrate-binding domain-containing protein [Rhodocyclaceae bacterium]
TITEERKKNIAFTAPYMVNHQIIVVLNTSELNAKAELAGKKVGVQEGSTAVNAVESDPVGAQIATLRKYGDNVTALLDLAAGRLDAVVVDEVVGRYYIHSKPGQYRVLKDDFGEEEYGVGLRKGDTELLAKLQAALDAMKADGTMDRIRAQWFAE